MQPKPRVIVTATPEDVHKVAEEIRARGLAVEDELAFTGNVILSSASDDDVRQLRQIRGVIAVEKERTDYRAD